MIFQTGIILALILLAAYSMSQRRRAPLVAAALLLCTVAGIVLVAMPEVATDIASAVGVGRGADLVFYVFIIITLTAIFNLHLRIRSHEELLTRLARAIAVEGARRPPERNQISTETSVQR